MGVNLFFPLDKPFSQISELINSNSYWKSWTTSKGYNLLDVLVYETIYFTGVDEKFDIIKNDIIPTLKKYPDLINDALFKPSLYSNGTIFDYFSFVADCSDDYYDVISELKKEYLQINVNSNQSNKSSSKSKKLPKF